MKQSIYVGARVQVMNQDMQGNPIIEGYATVKGFSPEPRYDDYVYCSVLFDGDDMTVYRWISTDVQS
jgi:hypothetical protein